MGFSAVQNAMGKPIAPFFRFPYLSHSSSMAAHLQNRQIATFSIDVDSKDYRTRDPGTVHRLIMGRPGALEEGHPAVPRHPAVDRPRAARRCSPT